MGSYIVNSVDEMIALGESVGRDIESPLVIDLIGEMGSGKTHFVKGLAVGLGVGESIKSPTFSIIDYYPDGRLPFYHIDAYRLEEVEEGYDIGLEDIFNEEAVVAIEWSQLFRDLFYGDIMRVEIKYLDDYTREVLISNGENK